MASLNTLIENCGRLAATPGVLVRVTAMLADHDYDPVRVAEIIRTDEALSAAVLRTVNSAAYGVPGRVFDLQEGIVRLGARRLMQIVLGHQTATVFDGAGQAYGLRRLDLWRSAIAGAVAAEAIATEYGVCEPPLAYVAALLRDIGKLAIEFAIGPHALDGIDARLASREGYETAERQLLGLDHAEIGAALAEKWGLPDQVVRAVRWHHDPPAPGSADADPLIDVVHAADLVAMWTGLAIGDDGLSHKLAPHVEQTVGITISALERFTAETWSKVQDLEATMHTPSTPGADR